MSGRRRDRLAHAPYPRTARVNEVLREVLAEELERHADNDERVGMLTVTGVETVADLTRAVVYLSSLDESTSEALEAHRAELQHAIAIQVRMKRTPHLEFAADPAVEQGQRVEEILRRVRHGADRTNEAVVDLDDGGGPRPSEVE